MQHSEQRAPRVGSIATNAPLSRAARASQAPALASEQASPWLWLAPLMILAAAGSYFVARYQGRWAETDSATFTRLIQSVVEGGRLTPTRGELYPNGYAFQVISAYLLALTGLDLPTLQRVVYPLTALLVALPAWLFFRELTGSARAAALSSVLLCLQPEFLFVVMRSSHEKFTRTLLFVCLYCLTRSLAVRGQSYAFAAHVGLFYLAVFALIASNNLFAHSFIFALEVVLLLSWLTQRRAAPAEAQSGQLALRCFYTVAICLGMVYVFTFYTYAPARTHLLLIQNIWDQIAALFLDVQSQPVNSYAQVASAWVNVPTYLLVSIANWIILTASFVIWAAQGWRWLRHGAVPDRNRQLVWFLYAALALQGAISVLADISGALSSNLQHRIFPTFATIAVVIVGDVLARWRPRAFARPLQVALALSFGLVAVLSVLKATNEPLLSNKWTFYRSEELAAISWGSDYLRNEDLWLEFDERLSTALNTNQIRLANGNLFAGGPPRARSRVLLLSAITRLRSARLGQPLPVPADALRVYDNGVAELYRLRPVTPYQR